ncbi:hypothetical protein HUT11_09275 [Streptomyces seoulensis]|nr:hypothetical protein HUT11_09275 [Streptomyces seoulensis]
MRRRGRARRRNPLRRRADVVRAWAALVLAVLVCAGAPLLGLGTAWWAYGEARAAQTAQRADRHRVRAEAVGDTRAAPLTARARPGDTRPVTVRWTQPGGRPRTATTRVRTGVRPGDPVDVWLDSGGRVVTAPSGDSTVWQYTVSLGCYATGGAVAVLLLGRAVARRVSWRRRLDEWDRAWARTGPRWSGRRA